MQTDTHTNTHTHINTMTRPGLGDDKVVKLVGLKSAGYPV